MTVFDLIKQGGISLIPLGVCSFLVLSVILERLWVYARVGKMPMELLYEVQKALARKDTAGALKLLDESSSPYAKAAKESLETFLENPSDTEDVLTIAIEKEIARAMRPLPILGTIGNIAPFIGLFGTVLGIMHAFEDMAHRGISNSVVISQGISEALIATAVGLCIGICAVVANNWCHAWVENYRREMDHFSTRWYNQLNNKNAKSNDNMLKKVEKRLEPVA